MTHITSTANAEASRPDALGFAAYAAEWILSCARSVARLTLRPMRRTKQTVMEEYDSGRWGRLLESGAWKTEADLREFLLGDRKQAKVVRIDGVACRIPIRSYYEYRLKALSDLLGRFFDATDEVVELGCGYGYNLFALALSWPRTRFAGFDISKNAVQAAQRIAAHFRLSDCISADVLDVTDPAHANFPRINGKNVFTFFCIEQIPYDVGKVVENLLAQRPKRVVHVEPGTALLKWWQLREWPNFLYLRSVDYQNELFLVLKRLEAEGRIRLIAAFRTPFSPSIQNSGLVIAWEPIELPVPRRG